MKFEILLVAAVVFGLVLYGVGKRIGKRITPNIPVLFTYAINGRVWHRETRTLKNVELEQVSLDDFVDTLTAQGFEPAGKSRRRISKSGIQVVIPVVRYGQRGTLTITARPTLRGSGRR